MRRLASLLILGFLLLLPSQSHAVSMTTTKFVADFEGFVSCPYADPAGHATIGYGHLLHYGPPTRADRRKWGCISKARALKLLKSDLRETEQEVFARIKGAKVTAPMIESGLTRLRQAFLAAGKGFPAGYLESSAEHWLVEERKYHKRVVLGEERLIATIQIGSSGSLPLYLPLVLEAILPTVPRFKVRVLAEPHARQDAADGDPTSLVAVAVARIVGR